MRKKSVGKNYILNIIYQLFTILVPLVTASYLSKVLGADGIGQYSYTYSLINYFVLFAALGFGYYGEREIANRQNDKKAQSILFWEIIIVRLFSVGISLSINCILATIGVYRTYTQLMWWWSLLIISQEFDISFLFQGNEDFLSIVIRTVIIKTLSIVLIFTLVKDSSQVWLYIICFAGSTLLGNISIWLSLPSCLVRIKLSELHPCKLIIPTLRLFIPTIAISLYTVLDKTLIGLIIQDTYTVFENVEIDGVEQTIEVVKKYSDLENGYYEQADKIINLCKTITCAMGTVMIPRNSNAFANNNTIQLKNNIYFTTNYVWFLGIPIMLGIIVLAPNLVPWFFGASFSKSISLIQLMSPLILLVGFSNVFGLQYLVPTKRDTKFTISILIGSLSNVALNVVLIYYFWSWGAVIASLIAEALVTITMALIVRKELSIKKIIIQSWKYWVAGIVMFGVGYVTQLFLSSSIINSIILILECVFVYLIVLIVEKDDFLKMVFKKAIAQLSKIKRKKQ